MGNALFSQKSQLSEKSTSVLLLLIHMSDTQQTQIDPLIALIAQQTALQVQIDRLIAQQATPPSSTGGRSSSSSVSASMNLSQRIPSIERLGGRCGRRRASRGHSTRANNSKSNEEDELSGEGESEKTISHHLLPETHKSRWSEYPILGPLSRIEQGKEEADLPSLLTNRRTELVPQSLTGSHVGIMLKKLKRDSGRK